jgi:hypothetical protein
MRKIIPYALVVLILVFGLGIRFGQTWTGTINSISPNFIEGFQGNFTQMYLDSINRTDVLANPEQPTSYTIYTEGSDYNAKNGSTGQIDYSGTVASTVIQNSLNGLTSGRTNKERVTLKGDFTLTSTLTIPSYTILDMSEASITLGANVHAMTITNTTDIELLGGIFNGVKATYNGDVWAGIGGTNATRILIKGTVLHDFEGKGIFITRLIDSAIENVVCYNNDQDGIYLDGTLGVGGSRNVLLKNCITYTNGRKGFNNGYIEQVTFVNCISHSNTQDGWNIEGGTGAGLNYYWADVKLIGCTAYSNSQNGYRIQMGGNGISVISSDAYSNTHAGMYVRARNDNWTITNVLINGGSYYNNTQGGITVQFGPENVRILGVSAYNNDRGNTNNDGIAIAVTNASQIMLSDIHAYDDQDTPTQDRGVDFGAGDMTAYNFSATNIYGLGNTAQLFRGTITATSNIQDYTDIWLNATNIDVDDYYRQGDNYTLWIETEIASSIAGVSGEGAPTEWDYNVILNGSLFQAFNPNGTRVYSNANAYTVIQNCINDTTENSANIPVWNTTHRVKEFGAVKLGAFEFPLGANYLKIPNHFKLEGCGEGTKLTFTGTYGIRHMWGNFSYDAHISNLMIEGDGGGGTYGIYWFNSNCTLPNLTGIGSAVDYYSWWVSFTSLYIRSCNTMIYLRSTIGGNVISRVDDIRGTGNIWIQRVYDSTFTDIFCSTVDMQNIVTNYFGNWYIGSGNWDISGGTQAFPCKGNIFDGIRSDNTLSHPALFIQGYFSENVFTGCQFANCRQGTGDNTEDCLDISTNSTHNTWVGSFFGNYASRSNIDTWRYLVRIRDGAHNNTWLGNVYTLDQADSGWWDKDSGADDDNVYELQSVGGPP